jgi:hypothetical protein
MTAPRIVRRWDGRVTLTFTYDPYLIDALKASVPAHARTYDPAVKSWTVAPAYAAIVTGLMHQVFHDVEEVTDIPPPPREPPPPADGDAFVVLHLRPTAPPELIDAAYRCLAKLHHPDRGGSHDQMLALTAAREALR